MKFKTKHIVALAAVLGLAAARPCAADITPNILGLPTGDTNGQAVAVNASGQVAGRVYNAAIANPCVWTGGRPTILPILILNGTNSFPGTVRAINDSGVAVGNCPFPEPPLNVVFMGPLNEAVRWTPNADGSYTVEDVGGNNLLSSSAIAINNQGQILGFGLNNTGSRFFFLWENGVRTPVTNSAGVPISVSNLGDFSFLLLGAFLSSNGRVAGTLDLGYQDPSAPKVYQAVLWKKTATGSTVTPLTLGGADDKVTASSPNGVVAGFSDANGFFLYDANTAVFSFITTKPADNGSVTYVLDQIVSVNDHGQALFNVFSFDSSTGSFLYDTLWVWQAGTWTQIPLSQLPIPFSNNPAERMGPLFDTAFINNNGQVAGSVLALFGFTNGNAILKIVGFGGSASAGIQQLLPAAGVDAADVLALSESGLAVGFTESFENQSVTTLPVTWNLSHTISWSGVLNPLNADGSSVFKAGSTVPVKFTLTGADAGITGLVATLAYARISDGAPGNMNQAGSKVPANGDSQFRRDSKSGQFIFNWSTKGLSPGSYELIIDLGDGSPHIVVLRLK